MPRLARGIVTLSLLIAAAWFVVAHGYWEDDAYIHLEFARSLAAGHGFSFNGHLVYGDTSPLWVWLLLAAHSVIPGWVHAGKALSLAAALFTLSGVFFYAHSLVRQGTRHVLSPAQAWLFAALMLLAFVLSPYFGYWAYSGMEALAAAGLAAWTCVLVARHRHSWRRLLLASCLAGLAPLLRPEMAFFSILLGVLLVRRIRFLRAPLLLRIDLLVASLVLLVTPAAAWGWYALRTFGSVLPNTNAAKRAAPADSVWNRLLHVYAFGYPVTLLACILLAAWLVWYALRGRHTQTLLPWASLPATGWLVFLWTVATTAFYVANHTFVQTRYIFITAPLLTVAVFALAALRWPNAYRNLLIVMLLFGAVVSLTSTRPLVRNKVQDDATVAQLADFVRSLPPDDPVAMYAIGQIAFLSRHSIIDTGGITRPGVMPYMYDADDARITAWIYTQGARYDVINHAPLPGSQLVWSGRLPVTGWYFNPRRYDATDLVQVWKLPPPQPQPDRPAHGLALSGD